MADDLNTVLTTLSRLQREGVSAIQLYRASYATPKEQADMRFWVQNELDKIQGGFSSADEVVRILAGAIQAVIESLDLEPTDPDDPSSPVQGPQGPQGPEGPPGPAGSGSNVYLQTFAPVGTEGDIWLLPRT